MGGSVTLAFGWFGLGGHLRDGAVKPMLNTLGGAGFDVGRLMSDPATAFPSAWSAIQAVATGVVQPVAMTVLGVILMFSLLQASTRIDADRDLGIRMVISTLFKSVLCIAFTQQASQLGRLVTGEVGVLLRGLGRVARASGSTLSRGLGDQLAARGALSDDLGTNIGLLLSLLLPALAAQVVGIAVEAVIYLRFIEIYVYTACAGLGVAFLGSQYTRGWGESYIRSFCSVVFKSFTLYLSLFLYSIASTGTLRVSQFSASHQLTADGSWLSGVWLSVFLLAGCLMVGNKAADAIFGR